MRLFDLPTLEPVNTTDSAQYQALGISAEYLLTARLLELGHKIAVPVTDDDGVDLVVNYHTLVQVKSSASRDRNGTLAVRLANRRASERSNGSPSAKTIREHIDVLAVYARDSRTWWFIPREDIPTSGLRLSEFKPDPWREAWHLFDQAGVST